jgi:LPXTG-motif cell wall-anchored protein
VKYSVYNYKSRRYDYFEGMGDVPASGWMRRGAPGPKIVEALAQRLPEGAQHIGSGAQPIGIIAVTQAQLAGLGSTAPDTLTAQDSSPTSALAWVGLAVLIGGAIYLGRKSAKYKISAP